MEYNYHAHTWRCHHANGTEEEYIQRAIECGIKHMGFSEHVPFIFPDGYEADYRLPVAEAKEYISELSLLRENIRTK